MLATTVPTVTTTVVVEVVEVVEDGETGADQDLEVGATTALVIARVTDPDPEIARNPVPSPGPSRVVAGGVTAPINQAALELAMIGTEFNLY